MGSSDIAAALYMIGGQRTINLVGFAWHLAVKNSEMWHRNLRSWSIYLLEVILYHVFYIMRDGGERGGEAFCSGITTKFFSFFLLFYVDEKDSPPYEFLHIYEV